MTDSTAPQATKPATETTEAAVPSSPPTAASPPAAASPPKAASPEPTPLETAIQDQPPAVPSPTDPGLLVAADGQDDDDDDSALGEELDGESSTASIASSILEYRTIQGRTFHSDRHKASYFTPNDAKQLESVDITHHYLTVLLDNKLFLAPIGDKPLKVLDIGTGTGIWAIDFADQFPTAEVIGTDLSPIQPTWVPPNLRFEIDDCTSEWTWDDNQFDFVHIRYLFGAIKDWTELFRQAHLVTKPGGWVQSAEAEVIIRSDDDSLPADSAMITQWNKLYTEASEKTGMSFTPLTDNIQRKSLEEAGFVDIQEANFKIPLGGWPRDPKLAEVGRFVQMTLNNDIEGYTMFIWNNVLGWPKEEYQIFLMLMRQELKNKKIHSYMTVRYVWGRKP